MNKLNNILNNKLNNILNNNLKEESKKELCYLCRDLEVENPKRVIYRLEDKEFGTLEPTCDFHSRFQLNLIWKEDSEDIEQIEKGIAGAKKEVVRRWLEISESVILEEKLKKWERLQKNYQPLWDKTNSCIEILKSKKKQLDLELYPS
ncbi:MAG: hypothetical protein MRERV_17c009 [Mycoplasmataceae bacterium RV_VA103A]|nr:MAG: hypothetical protein MRERV_22c040 [Mycoplasmataceae bacterium RV_VA103A]KLL04574.1 MAG: hypothetical protein MRERV_17c009 [Mycoplasmataceae bacterium RV_VA103A]